MRTFPFLFFFLANIISLSAQTVEWFPSKMNIQPFTANFLEPKAGFSYMLGRSELRLDIGASADVYHYQNKNSTLSFGSDLFTYTRLRGEREFHFPVETIDYLFGINAGYKITEGKNEFGFRLRLSHISAHFVDGQYDYIVDGWRNGKTPRVYSREFIEVFPFYRIGGFRVYTGLTFLFNSSPDIFGKGIYQLGFDYFITTFSKSFSPFLSYDFKIAKLNKFSGSSIVSAGLKFGNYDSKGFSILLSYFSGKSIHGEYFDMNEKYFTVGLNMDL